MLDSVVNVRSALEKLAIELACERITRQQLEDLKEKTEEKNKKLIEKIKEAESAADRIFDVIERYKRLFQSKSLESIES